jgi:hypothetical protein
MAQGDTAYQVRVLEEDLQLAQQAGREQNALRREALIGECMQLWRIAHRVKDRHRRSRGSLAQCDREGAICRCFHRGA